VANKRLYINLLPRFVWATVPVSYSAIATAVLLILRVYTTNMDMNCTVSVYL